MNIMKTVVNKSLILAALMVGIIVLASFVVAEKFVEIRIKTSAVCGMCKDRIEQGLAFEKGIKDVSLDLETKMVTVKYNSEKTNPDEIRKLISALGYDADSIPANQKAYDKLPACCKKDAEPHR